MKSNRNLSRGEGRRLGNVALIAFMLGSLLLLSVIRARFSPIGKTGEAIKAEEEQAMTKQSIKMEAAVDEAAASAAEEEDEETTPLVVKSTDTKGKGTGGGVVTTSSVEVGGNAAGGEHPTLTKKGEVCFETSRRSDTCEAGGDVRVQGRAQTIHVGPLDHEWKIKPYCRKTDAFALSHVREWTLRPSSSATPRCTVNSTATAFVLSTGGFTGNLFHDYTDVLIPAFITARRFAGDVQFLVSSHKSWWTSRYAAIFQQLSRHEVVDADADDEVRCYPNVVVGPRFHKELGVDPAQTPGGRYAMPDFRAMLRAAFGLERPTAAPSGDTWDIRRRPRLLIISRRATRRFTNERGMADMAMSLGFDVRVADPELTSDVSKFARLVNSADVMVGVHGAGLTNMVFLPAGAVVIQVVPYGGLEWLARGTFGEPCKDMELHYLEYRIALDETTLSEQYGKEDPVLKDPAAIHKQGWNALKTVYLDKQNVKPHLGRLKNTFLEALKLLPHGQAKN